MINKWNTQFFPLSATNRQYLMPWFFRVLIPYLILLFNRQLVVKTTSNQTSNVGLSRELSHAAQELQQSSPAWQRAGAGRCFDSNSDNWLNFGAVELRTGGSCCRQPPLAVVPRGMHSGRARWPRCHWSCSRSPSRSPSCSRSRCGCSSHPWSYLLLHCCAGKAQNYCNTKQGKQALPEAQVHPSNLSLEVANVTFPSAFRRKFSLSEHSSAFGCCPFPKWSVSFAGNIYYVYYHLITA